MTEAAVYLCSDESRAVTGQVLAVDGGWTVTEPEQGGRHGRPLDRRDHHRGEGRQDDRPLAAPPRAHRRGGAGRLRAGAAYDVASVCCRPLDVGRCYAALDGSAVAVGTVVGFPHGASTTAVKAAEAARALDDGATELDMVLPIGWLRSGEDAYVHDDIAAVVAVAPPTGPSSR